MALAAVLLVGGCVAPATDSGAFRANARGALDSGISETSTARMVVRQILDGRITGPAADTALSDAEDAMGPISDSFGKVQAPHPRDDSLRRHVLTRLGDAETAIIEARTAARRDDEAALRRARTELVLALRALQSAREDVDRL